MQPEDEKSPEVKAWIAAENELAFLWHHASR
jgi:hypothetical protein